jgi:hypothetical protein
MFSISTRVIVQIPRFQDGVLHVGCSKRILECVQGALRHQQHNTSAVPMARVAELDDEIGADRLGDASQTSPGSVAIAGKVSDWTV